MATRPRRTNGRAQRMARMILRGLVVVLHERNQDYAMPFRKGHRYRPTEREAAMICSEQHPWLIYAYAVVEDAGVPTIHWSEIDTKGAHVKQKDLITLVDEELEALCDEHPVLTTQGYVASLAGAVDRAELLRLVLDAGDWLAELEALEPRA